jgi:hypothetical protein
VKKLETLEEAVKNCEKSTVKCRSFFGKRLEQHMNEKGIAIPERIFSLFDTPFSAFTPEYVKMYEQKIKGQALFHIFSDMLVEIYQELDADKAGWETAANYLEDTPMRICALLALKRIDQLEEMPENDYLYMVEQFNGLSAEGITPQDQKFGVRPYAGMGKNHWWKKEQPKMASSGAN